MKRGPIPGVNVARNTASLGYRGGETGFFGQAGPSLDIAHNTLRNPFARQSGGGGPPREAESVGCPETLRKIMAYNTLPQDFARMGLLPLLSEAL